MADVLARFMRNVGKSPEEAKFFWAGGPVEIAPHTWFASAFSGVVAFETDEGIVLVDSGLKRMGSMLAGMIRQRTKAKIHTVVFTQGHVDHAFGLEAFVGDEHPRVIAHRAMPARFERYALTAAHNMALNARQFGGTVNAAQDATHGQDYATFGPPAIEPNELYDEQLDFTVGGVAFEVHHCRGETDDHSWVWCPDREVLCPGNLFIWAVPNAGNPQKVQRYPWEWANGLRAMAAKRPRHLCPGHGGPVIDDPEKIQAMLLETADFLDVIVAQTIEAMNEGAPPHVDIVHRVALPTSESPWLQNVYDDAEFIIRNIIRFYGGWYSGRPSELKPPTRESLAQEIVALAGGALQLAERAKALSDEGRAREACALADYALEAASGDSEVRRIVAQIYRRRADGEESLMARNLFASAAAYADEGRPYR